MKIIESWETAMEEAVAQKQEKGADICISTPFESDLVLGACIVCYNKNGLLYLEMERSSTRGRTFNQNFL